MSQKISTQEFLALIGQTDLPCEKEERFLIFSSWEDNPAQNVLKGTELNFATQEETLKEVERANLDGAKLIIYDIQKQEIID